MTMRTFIQEHRIELDEHIRRATGQTRINNREREMWILNDEHLYLWARYEGVKV